LIGFVLFRPKVTPVPLRRWLALHTPGQSPVDEVLDGLDSALGRWVRHKLKRSRRTG